MSDSFPFDVRLEREGERPLYEQLRDALARAIDVGDLAEGARLPSTRAVADALAVNRATAVEAYRRLEQDGLVQRRHGSGTYVRPKADAAGAPARARGSRALRELERTPSRAPLPEQREDAIDLAGLVAHERDYPAAVFQSALERVLVARGGAALGYGAPAGDAELREVLAERMRGRGLRVESSGILIVAGAQQGLDLLFRALVDPGDPVVTESPTYHLALDLLRLHRAEVLPVPLTPTGQEGLATLDFDRLADVLARRRPALAYAMPSFQNPTGLTLDLASRRRLATACASAGVLLVEDDYEADMAHDGAPLPPVASLEEAGAVAYVGTLSKALFPGLRVGWIAGSPDVVARVAQVKRVADLSGPVLLQAVAAQLISSGAYDEHIARARRAAGERMKLMADALEELLPRGARITRPRGGHVLWLEAPVASGRALVERAARHGVAVTGGEAFASEAGGLAGARVSIARVERSQVKEAASRLAAAVTELMAEGGGRSGRTADHESPVVT